MIVHDDSSKDSNVKATIDAVTGLVKEIPIYQDTLQPAAKQIGKSLEVVSKTVNLALAPIKALVWGYEQIEDYITKRVSEKLKDVPTENIVTPSPQIAGPTVEALRYAGHEESLRELYANLLATSMDKETIVNAHPGYVDIIKSITPDEAILMTVFKNEFIIPLVDILAYEDNGYGQITVYSNHSHLSKMVNIANPLLVPSYIDNLCRLGILNIPANTSLTTEGRYTALEEDPDLVNLKNEVESKNKKIRFKKKFAELTNFGRLFVESVVKSKC